MRDCVAKKRDAGAWARLNSWAWYKDVLMQGAVPILCTILATSVNNFASKIAYMHHRQAIQPNGVGLVVG